MGEWLDIFIDDQLPKKYAAKPRKGSKEYWVALVEKAYAKFFGGYKNIIGGDPTWALFNLTGGITLEVLDFSPATMKDMKDQGFDFFDFLREIQEKLISQMNPDYFSVKLYFTNFSKGRCYFCCLKYRECRRRFNNTCSFRDGWFSCRPCLFNVGM